MSEATQQHSQTGASAETRLGTREEAASPGQAASPVWWLQGPSRGPWGSPRVSQAAHTQCSPSSWRKTPMDKVMSPQTGSQWPQRQTLKGTSTRGRRQGQSRTSGPAGRLGGNQKDRSTGVHSLHGHLPASDPGGSVPDRSRPSPGMFYQAGRCGDPRRSPPTLPLPGRAAHLCAGTRRCSPRWTSARRPGPAAGC